MPRQRPYGWEGPRDVADDGFLDLGFRVGCQQPEGFAIIYGLQDEAGAVPAYPKRAFQRRHRGVCAGQLDVEATEAACVQLIAKSVKHLARNRAQGRRIWLSSNACGISADSPRSGLPWRKRSTSEAASRQDFPYRLRGLTLEVVMLLDVLAVAGGVALAAAAISLRVVKQYERGLVFRFGRVLDQVRGPGLAMIVPIVDRLRKVNLQIVTMGVPAQEGITRDNVTVKVDAVVYFRVVDPVRAIVSVEDYPYAVSQVAQTSLRSIIGKSDLDDLLTNRERLNEGLELMLDNPAVEWGIHIDRVEIKDVALPETMKRSMSRQAEAERERRARVISAEGELQASDRLAKAAAAMADTPGALQLRLLETIVQVASEKNSTLVLPFPVELLRFLETNSNLAASVSAPRAGDKPAVDLSAASPNRQETIAGPPEVAALESENPLQEDRSAIRTPNRLSPVQRSRPSAKHAS